MPSLSLLAAAAMLGAAAALPELDLSAPAMKQEIIDAVNSAPGASWVAGVNPRFEGMTLGQVKAMLGTKRDPKSKSKARLGKSTVRDSAVGLPTNFDVRTHWPQCANVTGHIRDQSSCGSCWAFGSTEAFNDRMCIAYNYNRLLSPTDTMACCNADNGCYSSSGCDGGEPSDAWNYFTTVGVVTGDDYGSAAGSSCYPYPFAQCSHHEPGKYPDCPSGEYNTPSCPNACSDSAYPISWSNDKHFGKTAYGINSVSQAMQELNQYGSITAAFDVYEDFITYRSGIYVQQTGSFLGGHAVKIIGYGTQNGQDYWVVANSWNQYWGLNGTFWIAKGVDECGIEDDLVAGLV